MNYHTPDNKFHLVSTIRNADRAELERKAAAYDELMRPVPPCMHAGRYAYTPDEEEGTTFCIVCAYGDLKKIEALHDKRAQRMEDALEKIKNWTIAYPLKIFPEPNFKRVRELLEAGGITIDSVSASNMRQVIKGVAALVEEGLTDKPRKKYNRRK